MSKSNKIQALRLKKISAIILQELTKKETITHLTTLTNNILEYVCSSDYFWKKFGV